MSERAAPPQAAPPRATARQRAGEAARRRGGRAAGGGSASCGTARPGAVAWPLSPDGREAAASAAPEYTASRGGRDARGVMQQRVAALARRGAQRALCHWPARRARRAAGTRRTSKHELIVCVCVCVCVCADIYGVCVCCVTAEFSVTKYLIQVRGSLVREHRSLSPGSGAGSNGRPSSPREASVTPRTRPAPHARGAKQTRKPRSILRLPQAAHRRFTRAVGPSLARA